MPRKENTGPIQMPSGWKARPHQVPLWNAMMRDKVKRAVAVWHRRAGKDSAAVNITATKAVLEPGLYYYMAPSQKHARKIIWDNVGSDGRRIVNQAFPEAIRKATNDQEMRIVLDLPDGQESIFQVVGSDNYDSLVGTNPKGIVFSEWSLSEKPEAWDYFLPILMENDGWAIFIYTPRGLNHGYKTYHAAMADPDWYCELLTITDTKRENGKPVVDPVEIEHQIEMGHTTPIKARQEFYCDWLQATETQVFNSADVMACMQRPAGDVYDPNAPRIMGVDVAYAGDDRTVCFTRSGRDGRTVAPLVLAEGRQRAQANRIYEHAMETKPDMIVVDRTGPGHGMYEILKHEMRLPVKGVHFGQNAKEKDKYFDIRAELAVNASEWCATADCLLPDDSVLREELMAIRYMEEPDVNGRLRLEPKKLIKAQMGRSPDIADAFMLTFAVNMPRRDLFAFGGGGPRQTKAKRTNPFDR